MQSQADGLLCCSQSPLGEAAKLQTNQTERPTLEPSPAPDTQANTDLSMHSYRLNIHEHMEVISKHEDSLGHWGCRPKVGADDSYSAAGRRLKQRPTSKSSGLRR